LPLITGDDSFTTALFLLTELKKPIAQLTRLIAFDGHEGLLASRVFAVSNTTGNLDIRIVASLLVTDMYMPIHLLPFFFLSYFLCL
jgi:hypothetical protein